MKSKKKSLREIVHIVNKLKSQGKTIVFTNGCFDLLHEGHIRYLAKAKKSGDILIVGLNSDNSVKKIKGQGRPILKEKERVTILSALEMINYVIVFEENTPINVIKKIKPHYHVKGGDYKLENLKEKKAVEMFGGRIKIISLVKGKSTSKIIEKIKENKKSKTR